MRGIHRPLVDTSHKWPVARSFEVFFDVHLNIRLKKDWNRRWFQTPWPPLWRHCNRCPLRGLGLVHLLTQWGREPHIRKWTNQHRFRPAPSHYLCQCWDILNWPLGTNFCEISIEIHTFLFKKMHFILSPGKRRPCFSRPQCANLVLTVLLVISSDMEPIAGSDCIIPTYHYRYHNCIIYRVFGNASQINLTLINRMLYCIVCMCCSYSLIWIVLWIYTFMCGVFVCKYCFIFLVVVLDCRHALLAICEGNPRYNNKWVYYSGTILCSHVSYLWLIWRSPDSKVHGTNMGPIWGRQDPDGHHVVPIDLAIWVSTPRWNQRLFNLQVSCRGLYLKIEDQDRSPNNCH